MSKVLAASITISPTSGSYVAGNNFTVTIQVSSIDQAMNAVQGVLLYPADKLSVVEFSKSGSIINLWVQEPFYNNGTGRLSFEGVALNPGFTGSAGRILRVTFRSKAEGTATLSFTNVSVLANDGSGTNILSSVGTGRYLIEARVEASRFPSPDVTFSITPVKTGVIPNPSIKLEVKNLNKPIDHYEIRADQEDFVSWTDPEKNNIYRLPVLSLGKHIINARAYYEDDKFLEAVAELTVESLPFPEITEYPKIIDAGEVLVIRGKSLPNAKIYIFIQQDIGSITPYIVSSDSSGDFVFVYDQSLSSGVYKFWASVEDERGARSENTEKFSIAVREKAIIRIGSWLINLATVIAILIVLIALCVFIIVYVWYRIRIMRKHVKKEVSRSEVSIHQVFRALKKDVEEQLMKLENARTRRELTEEEREMSKVLISHLGIVEEFIRREMENIKGEVFGEHHHQNSTDHLNKDKKS